MPLAYDATGIEYFSIPNFKFASGATCNIRVAYHSFNRGAKKTALIPTCFAGRINDTLNFTSGALKDYRVIVVGMLGGGESSSPSNNMSFPNSDSLRYEDCITSQYILVTEHLGLKSLDLVVGHSMGGQQAYYWAVMHGSGPDPFVKNVVPICSSAKTSDYAFLEGPIAALTTSYDYAGGKYKENAMEPTQGLRAFGRAYAAWLSSPEWFRQNLWKQFGAASLKDWLHPPEGTAVFESWDAEDLIAMARIWQSGDIGTVAGGGSYRKALESISSRVLVMPSLTDQYFPPEDGENEVKSLKNGIYDPINTIWGHIWGANETDIKWVDRRRVGQFLDDV